MKPIITVLAYLIASYITHSQSLSPPSSTSDLRYKLDGDFSDWKSYTKGWTDKYLGYENISRRPRGKGVAFKGCYYDNDDIYLYLFLKCSPTPQTEIDRFQKKHGKGMYSSSPYKLGSLWIDTDLNKETGSKASDEESKLIKRGLQFVQGAEIYIQMQCGMYYDRNRGIETMGHYISYSIQSWNQKKLAFNKESKKYTDRKPPHLIQHGKHGIEMAIPLTDLALSHKKQISLTLWEYVTYSLKDTKNILITLK